MNYTNYNFYKLKYIGNEVPQNDFEILSVRASEIIQSRIFNRDIMGYENKVQEATCSVAEVLYKIKNIENKIYSSDNKEVKSESVGDYSKTYNTASVSEQKEKISNLKQEIERKIRMYLADTGLLYRGV